MWNIVCRGRVCARNGKIKNVTDNSKERQKCSTTCLLFQISSVKFVFFLTTTLESEYSTNPVFKQESARNEQHQQILFATSTNFVCKSENLLKSTLRVPVGRSGWKWYHWFCFVFGTNIPVIFLSKKWLQNMTY